MSGKMISFRLTDAMIQQLDAAAERLGVSRTSLIQDAIEQALKRHAAWEDRERQEAQGFHDWPDQPIEELVRWKR